MELMVDLTENKNTSMLSLQGFQLLGRGGVKPACRDGFTRIELVEKEALTYSVLCWLVTSPRPLREGVHAKGAISFFVTIYCEM